MGLGLYGNYRTSRFVDVKTDDWTSENNKRWTSDTNFLADWKASGFYSLQGTYTVVTDPSTVPPTTETRNLIADNDIKLIFFLLYAEYGNSSVASSDEYQFKTKIFETIFKFAPTWLKNLYIQRDLRDLSLEELQKGTKAIYNTALNPQTSPNTQSLEELTYINSQNTTGYKKSKLEAYASIIDILNKDVTTEFVQKFKRLFLTVVSPEETLLYVEDN